MLLDLIELYDLPGQSSRWEIPRWLSTEFYGLLTVMEFC